MSEAKIVKTLTHRERDDAGRRLGHVAFIQRRSDRKLKRFSGKRWASWARRTVDGEVLGTPERFETYDTEAEALAHAIYAAGQRTPTRAELEAFGGRLP